MCYDEAARNARKKHRREDSALNLAAAMGIELLTEAEYRKLQELGEFDRLPTSGSLAARSSAIVASTTTAPNPTTPGRRCAGSA
jgi:hypothetical protein